MILYTQNSQEYQHTKNEFMRFRYVYVYVYIRGLLEKYPTFGREKETGLLGAMDT